MKPTRNPDELDSLLGRGGGGATRRDAILQSVLARVEAKIPVRMSRGWPLAVLILEKAIRRIRRLSQGFWAIHRPGTRWASFMLSQKYEAGHIY